MAKAGMRRTDPKALFCPYCNGNDFVIKYEAAYVYSYVLDKDAPGLNNRDEFLSYLYDNREQIKSDQYIECNSCNSKFPCYFNKWDGSIGAAELQSVINAGYRK